MVFNFLLLSLTVFAASCQVKGSGGNSNINDNSILGIKVSDDVARSLLRENISAGDLFDNEKKNNAIVAAARQNRLFFKIALAEILAESDVAVRYPHEELYRQINNSEFFSGMYIRDGNIERRAELIARLIEKVADLGAPAEQINGIIRVFTQRGNLSLEDFNDLDKIRLLARDILRILRNQRTRTGRMMLEFLSLIPVDLSNLHDFLDSIKTIFAFNCFVENNMGILVDRLTKEIGQGNFTPIKEKNLRRDKQISQPSDIITDGVFKDEKANAELANILARNDRFFITLMFESLFSLRAIRIIALTDLDGAIASGNALGEILVLVKGGIEGRIERNLRTWLKIAFNYASIEEINSIIKDVIGNDSIQLKENNDKEIADVADKIWSKHPDRILRVILSLIVLGKVYIYNIEAFIDNLNENDFALGINAERINDLITRAKNEVNQIL